MDELEALAVLQVALEGRQGSCLLLCVPQRRLQAGWALTYRNTKACRVHRPRLVGACRGLPAAALMHGLERCAQGLPLGHFDRPQP